MSAKTFLLLLAAGALLAVPAAAADETPQNGTPDEGERAWVEDCPPDMMCAMAPPEDEGARDDADQPTYSGDCGGEVCAMDGAPSDAGSSCMDGEQAGEACRDDIRYLAPPQGDEVETSGEAARRPVPAAGVALAIVGGAVALALVGMRRLR